MGLYLLAGVPSGSGLAQLLRGGALTRTGGAQHSPSGVSASCLGRRDLSLGAGAWPRFALSLPLSSCRPLCCSIGGLVRPESPRPSCHFKEGPMQLGTHVIEARCPVSWLTLLNTKMPTFKQKRQLRPKIALRLEPTGWSAFIFSPSPLRLAITCLGLGWRWPWPCPLVFTLVLSVSHLGFDSLPCGDVSSFSF